MRNPQVVASRPYGCFLEEPFFENPSLVRKLQEILVNEQIEGAWELIERVGLLHFLRTKGPRFIWVSKLRNFDKPLKDPVSKASLVEFGVRTFGWMVRHIPNVFIIHNFHYGELKQQFELTEKMMERDRHIAVYDMRQRIPADISDSELQSWYLYPHMIEKWSLKGHRVYGHLVADLLVEKKLLPQ